MRENITACHTASLDGVTYASMTVTAVIRMNGVRVARLEAVTALPRRGSEIRITDSAETLA